MNTHVCNQVRSGQVMSQVITVDTSANKKLTLVARHRVLKLQEHPVGSWFPGFLLPGFYCIGTIKILCSNLLNLHNNS